MLFLHGYLSSKEAFTAQIEYFSKFYKVTAIDFIGFGQSPPLQTPYSVDDYATWLEQKMTELGIRKPHVIAHSFGCRVAIKLASRDNSVFDKILLTGTAGVILNRGIGYHIKVKTYKIVKKFAPNWSEQRFGSEEYRSLSPVMKESYKKIVNEDLRGCAAKVKNQVLLVQGTEDKTTTLAEAQAYLENLERGTLKKIEGGHFAFCMRPLAFNLIAEEFFYE